MGFDFHKVYWGDKFPELVEINTKKMYWGIASIEGLQQGPHNVLALLLAHVMKVLSLSPHIQGLDGAHGVSHYHQLVVWGGSGEGKVTVVLLLVLPSGRRVAPDPPP